MNEILLTDTPGGSPPIQVLLAGNIADDDMMWVVRCAPSEVASLVLSPVRWVAALADLPDWRAPNGGEAPPAPVLSRDLAMIVSPTETADPDGWLTVQGISGTNQLSLVASREAALGALPGTAEGRAPDSFDAFWDAVASDPTNEPSGRKAMPLNALRANARFYAHFELFEEGDGPRERAARAAAFLLAAALDPEGYEKMLRGLDQRALYVDGEGAAPGKPVALSVPRAPGVVYANAGTLDAPTGEDDPNPPMNFCNFLDGRLIYEEGTGEATGTMVKRWGVEATGGDGT